jgi:hypothetical protein
MYVPSISVDGIISTNFNDDLIVDAICPNVGQPIYTAF